FYDPEDSLFHADLSLHNLSHTFLTIDSMRLKSGVAVSTGSDLNFSFFENDTLRLTLSGSYAVLSDTLCIYAAGCDGGVLAIPSVISGYLDLEEHDTGKEIKLYPNPSHGNMIICNAPKGKATVMSCNGSKLIDFQVVSDKQQVLLPGLPAGVYIVYFENGSSVRLALIP